KLSPLKSVAPPNPFQRPTGTRASNPARSADWARVLVVGHVSCSTPSAVEATVPLLQFVQKVPSFRRLSLKRGLVQERLVSAAVIGFHPLPRPSIGTVPEATPIISAVAPALTPTLS